MLGNWVVFEKSIENIEEFNEKKINVKRFVDVELNRIEEFHKVRFFKLYPEFEIETIRFRSKFAHYMDTDIEYMKSAAELYFLQLYGNNPENPEFEVKFEEKSNPGAQVSSNK